MVVITVMYPGSGDETFDYGYYMSKHIPLVHERWDGMGMQSLEVLRGSPGPGGAKPPFSTMAILRFGSLDQFKAASDAHGTEIFGDIPKFTDAKPVMQFNEVAG